MTQLEKIQQLEQAELNIIQRGEFLLNNSKNLIPNVEDMKFLDFYLKYSILKKFKQLPQL